MAQFDLEVRRWMHEPLRVSYVLTYWDSFRGETNLTFLRHEPVAMFLAGGWVVLPLLHFTYARTGSDAEPTAGSRRGRRPSLVLAVVSVCVLALLGTSPKWFMPSKARARRTQPVLLTLGEEIGARLGLSKGVQRPQLAALDLKNLVERGRLAENVRAAKSVHADYPLFTKSEGSGAAELGERPHVFLIVVESYRAWLSGMMPNSDEPPVAPFLQELTRSGVRFPLTHAAGFPSAEAAIGLHLGLWSHPEKVIAAEYLHVATLSFPEILRNAGYEARALFGTEPSFDNLTPWFQRWYDEVHFSPRFYGDDKELFDYAGSFLETIDFDRPQLITVLNSTTHVPYRVPKSSGVIPARTSEKRYRQAMSYFDAQLESFVSTLKRIGLWESSLIVIVGDHAQPRRRDRARPVWEDFHVGHTWTPLAFVGGWPELPDPRLVKTTTSQVDLAPTLLSLLRIDSPHHFVGRPLLAPRSKPQPVLGERPAYALRAGMLLEQTDHRQKLSFFDSSEVWERSRGTATVQAYGLFDEAPGAALSARMGDTSSRRLDAFLSYGRLFDGDRIIPREVVPQLPRGRYVHID